MKEAIPPAIPAHAKYDKKLCSSYLKLKTFKLSFTAIKIALEGTFIKYVILKLLIRENNPSFTFNYLYIS